MDKHGKAMLAELLIVRGWQKEEPQNAIWIYQGQKPIPTWFGGDRPHILSFDLRFALHMTKIGTHLLISLERQEVAKADGSYQESKMQSCMAYRLYDFYEHLDTITGYPIEELVKAAKRPQFDPDKTWAEIRNACS